MRIESGDEVVKILRHGHICFLSMVDGKKPYVVPLNYGYAENALFFHSALEGRKIRILGENPDVSFCIVSEYELVRSGNACSWTTDYLSVMGTGKATILREQGEKNRGLTVIMGHYSEREFDFSGAALEDVAVIRVDIETMEGKRGS
ncbi:MAG: pyridoxamine 5'-phosphate oxidase family protein [Proteobacteria bacterium]|nr:pyridoxamine 5'-phosphate oxidase family protein [Pseudomonadota bacterium]